LLKLLPKRKFVSEDDEHLYKLLKNTNLVEKFLRKIGVQTKNVKITFDHENKH
jgi:hypothetical protein